MSSDCFWLALTVAMTGLMWVPFMLDRFAVRGIMGTLRNPDPFAGRQSEWAERMMAAHTNAVENLIIFAPLVLMLDILDVSTPTTVAACATFFWARLVHLVVFTIGIPVVRTAAFLVGFGAQAVLVLVLFGVM